MSGRDKASTARTSTPAQEQHCKLCQRPYMPEMVACDKCDAWFHFVCVNVDSNVADVSWRCETCRKDNPTKPNDPAKSATLSSISRASSKRRQLLMQQLEEEKQLREESNQLYLQKKYQILAEASDSEDEDPGNKGKSEANLVDRSQFTQKWVEKSKAAVVMKADVPARSTHDQQQPLTSAATTQSQPDPFSQTTTLYSVELKFTPKRSKCMQSSRKCVIRWCLYLRKRSKCMQSSRKCAI